MIKGVMDTNCNTNKSRLRPDKTPAHDATQHTAKVRPAQLLTSDVENVTKWDITRLYVKQKCEKR